MRHESSQTLHDFVESILVTAQFGLMPALIPALFCLESTLKLIVALLKPAFKQKMQPCAYSKLLFI